MKIEHEGHNQPKALSTEDAIKHSLSAHFAALVAALSENDDGVRVRFMDALAKLYEQSKDNAAIEGVDNIELLESLRWTRDLLKK